MQVTRRSQPSHGLRFAIDDGGTEIARAYHYVMQNDLYAAPFGLLEDVFVDQSRRGGGLGTQLITEVVAAAREAGCYKLIATSRASRAKVHELYRQFGFQDYGIEFRLDFNSTQPAN